MKYDSEQVLLVASGGNNGFAEKLAKEADLTILNYSVHHYLNDNLFVKVPEVLRKKTVYVVQSLDAPVHKNLFHLLMLGRVARDQKACQVIAVIPYFSYQRSDKRANLSEPLTAKLIADLLEVSGFTSAIFVDLHTPQIEGFFNIPIVNIDVVNVAKKVIAQRIHSDKTVLVAPDLGAFKRVEAIGKELAVPFCLAHKKRSGDEEVAINMIEEWDRERTHAIIVDDTIITGTTLRTLVDELRSKHSFERVDVLITHGVMVGKYVENLVQADIDTLYLSDTIDVTPKQLPVKVIIYSVIAQIADEIKKDSRLS